MKQKPGDTLLDLFHRAGLTKIRLGPRWASFVILFDTADRDAAWELYVEMLTRVVTQPLPLDSGDEKAALDSVYSLFPTTREILRKHGRGTHFSKVAVPILNQVVRPFTTKWHGRVLSGRLKNRARKEFRDDLSRLLESLRKYNKMLAEIAEVEDLTELENDRRDHG